MRSFPSTLQSMSSSGSTTQFYHGWAQGFSQGTNWTILRWQEYYRNLEQGIIRRLKRFKVSLKDTRKKIFLMPLVGVFYSDLAIQRYQTSYGLCHCHRGNFFSRYKIFMTSITQNLEQKLTFFFSSARCSASFPLYIRWRTMHHKNSFQRDSALGFLPLSTVQSLFGAWDQFIEHQQIRSPKWSDAHSYHHSREVQRIWIFSRQNFVGIALVYIYIYVYYCTAFLKPHHTP